MKPYYTNKVDLELQDPYHNNSPHIITTISSIASAGGLTTSSGLASKMVPSMANAESVDKAIDISMLIEKSSSYQQKQQLTEVYSGSTINQSNNIVLANRELQFASSSSGRIDSNSLALNSTYNSVASVTSSDKPAKTYQNKLLVSLLTFCMILCVLYLHALLLARFHCDSVNHPDRPHHFRSSSGNCRCQRQRTQVQAEKGQQGGAQ